MRAVPVAALGLALACFANACRSPAPEARTPLAVFAASSLTEAFADLEQGFEATHPEVDVQLTFAGSQVLRLQIEQGAAADVFASANEQHMRALVDAGLVGETHAFAANALVVIVPLGPGHIERFEQLAEAQRVVVGTENVPVGRYAGAMLDKARAAYGDAFAAAVRAHIVSEESNVRLLRAKVELGEADAAVVYGTDASPRVRVVAIPAALNVRATYPIAAVSKSPHATEAAQFIEYVRSPAGQGLLRRHGFLPADAGIMP
ncbi:MAG: molybdate ABC transporter substrate-binding protein [Myxococcales bacterium]|nr:molybdate ABC transporter substrate-binding protein [Myxococcales bacterium]